MSNKWVFTFFNFIINKGRHKIHSARRNIVELKTWLRQKQPPEVFYKKGVLKNFTKFTGKHLCQSLFLMKLQASAIVSAEKTILEKLLERG